MSTRIWLIITLVAMLLLIPAAAGGALVDEQRQGQNLIAQLRAGTKTCSDLSADELDHIGEYVMFTALGSTAVHQAMNDRMTQMMGEQAETRMHQLLGARYTGCSTKGLGIPGPGSMMGGGGMMGGGYNSGGLGAMMSSSDWSWMMTGSWEHMSPPGLAAPATHAARHQQDEPSHRLARARHHRRHIGRRRPRAPRDPRDHPPPARSAPVCRCTVLLSPAPPGS